MSELMDGIIVKEPPQNAPQFVKYNLSFKIDEFIQELKNNDNKGWVNAQILLSKGGKPYVKINNYKKPEAKEENDHDTSFMDNNVGEYGKLPF